MIPAWMRAGVLALGGVLALHGYSSESCPLYERFEAHASSAELAISTTPALDPDDPEQVQVDALLRGPDGALTVQPCFWEVPQRRYLQQAMSSERGKEVPWERFRDALPGRWSLRFMPRASGSWQWRWRVRAAGAPERELAGGTFAVGPALHTGSLLLSGGGGLCSADGTPFIPIGLNIAWPNEDGSQMFAHYLDRLQAVGGNCARLWLVHYYGGTCLEWSHGEMDAGYRGVGHYSQEAAARVDALLEAAQERDIRLIVCLWTFGDLSFDWNDNPYSRTSPGGWLTQPAQFFTDPRALAAQRHLLRYCVARWGAYRSLGIWELWNEVDNCRGFNDAEVGAWHRLMAHELHDLDPQRHPIATSFRFSPPLCPCSAYQAPDITLCESHTYWPSLVSAVQTEGANLQPFGKPWQVDEFGMSDDPAALKADPDGLHLHDGMWAALFAGSVGGGFCWWWDSNIEAHDLWRHFIGISRFTHGESLDGLVAVNAQSEGPATAVLERAGVARLWAWVRTLRHVLVHGVGVDVGVDVYAIGRTRPARAITLSHAGNGLWQATWWDPYDGTWIATSHGRAAGGSLHLLVPEYRDDICLKAVHLGAEPAQPDAAAAVPATPWHDELTRRDQARTP
jgi:hypothetical protein